MFPQTCMTPLFSMTDRVLSFAKLTKYKKGVVPLVPIEQDAPTDRQFETHRTGDYDGFSWIKLLNKRQIERVEEHCVRGCKSIVGGT